MSRSHSAWSAVILVRQSSATRLWRKRPSNAARRRDSRTAGRRAGRQERAEASVAPGSDDDAIEREEQCNEDKPGDQQSLLHVSTLPKRGQAVGTADTLSSGGLHVKASEARPAAARAHMPP